MAKTRIFISHSSHQQETRERLRAICDRLTEQGFNVLVDYDVIKSGDQWRQRIHASLAECQAAAVLFDREALDSPWVLKEATILAWRNSLEKNDFTLMPILLDDVNRNELKTTEYSPLLLSEIQHVSSNSIKDIVAEISKIPAGLETPTLFDQLTTRIADQLESTGSRTLEEVAASHFPSAQFTHGESRKCKFADLLARKIFSEGPACLSVAIGILDSFGGSLSDSVASRILELVEPLWVEADAAALIPEANLRSSGFRDLAFCSRRQNTFYSFTAESYIKRGYQISNRWQILKVEEPDQEDPVKSISFIMCCDMREKTPSLYNFDEDDIQDFINNGFSEPLFVLLPWIPGKDILEELREQYPKVTFLMYTAKREAEHGPLFPGARYVKPELSEDIENRAFSATVSKEVLINKLRN